MHKDQTAGSDSADGRDAVTKPWSDSDFKQPDEYKQGPTESKGAGKCNESHS